MVIDRETIIKLTDPHDHPEPHTMKWTQVEMDYINNRINEAVAAEREACAKLVEPTEEHRRDASWGYIGGDEGVELLDNLAAAIRARGNT